MTIEDCAKDGSKQFFTKMRRVSVKNRYLFYCIGARLKNAMHLGKEFLDTILIVIVYSKVILKI